MDTYKKPFIKNNCENLKHPYPRSMFKEYDIFPLIILDGGGFFFLKDHFGNESILEGIKSGKLFDLWRNEGKIDWKLPMKMHEKAEFKPWEHMVWINRLYFLLPIAQEFYRTGNEEWADLWYKYFSQWNEDNPYEPYDKRHYLDANLIWRDMQVCWRLLVLIHSVYLLEGSKALDGQKWESIYRSIEVHAGHIHREALDHLVSGRVGGNHYQQKGLALLYAGVLFPEFGMSEQYINAGKEIILNHFRDQIFSDGGSVEGSPSYSHFIARIYVEAFLLLKKNGLEEIEGLEEGIQKQY